MSDGSEILAELRSVVATLEQSAYLQLIIPGARSFIDWYDGLLKGSDSAFGILIGYSEAQIFNIKKSLLSIQGNPPEDIAQAWKHLVESSFRYEMDENRRYHIPPDVWQLFIRKREIETALQLLNSGDVEPLKGVISETFGYEIRLAEGDNWSQWEDELLNLLTANLQIAAFFQEMLGSNSGLSGLDIVHQFFAQNPDGNPIEILLGGADQYMGRVPLPQSTSDLDELRRVRFGSDVSVATIVHEFGHQFDRWFQLLEDERYGGAGGVTEYFNRILTGKREYPLMSKSTLMF